MSRRVLVLAVALAWPVAAGAQTVAGAVLDGLSGRPVVGAMVRLLDGDGRETGALFLTASEGRFVLRAPRPGRYGLAVERIGFARTRVDPFDVGPDETLRVDVRVASQPVRLEGLEVHGHGRRCDIGRGDSGATQSLWDEARKALAAATWTEREAGLRFRVSTSERIEDPRSRAVRDEQRRVRTLFGGNSVRTLPPEDLAREGYVREADGSRYFYGPDAETLLSDAFLETHCFEVVDGDGDDARLVGLAFEPVDGREVPDIEGRLWMDRATGRLDRIEFSYTRAFEGAGQGLAGGFVRFAELADGRWIVREWSIRAPLVGVQRAFGPRTGTVERRMVTGVSVQGTTVLSVVGEGIDWRSDRGEGSVVGVVWDSTRAAPLAGADVRLAGRGWRALTDDEGRFELVDVPPGTYRIGFLHPRVDTLSLEPWWTEVTVEEGRAASAALAIPGEARLPAHRRSGEPGGAALLANVVSYVDGRPIDGVAVSLVDSTGAARVSGLSDGEGRVLLVAPAPGSYALRAERPGYAGVQGAPVAVGEGTRRVEVRLSVDAIPLDEVVVEVRGTVRALELNGFYRRELMGTGTMLDREALDRLTPAKAGDVLRRQAGVTVASGSHGMTTRRFFVFRSATRAFGSCLPTVYLDGQVVRSGGPYTSDRDERLTLDEIVPVHDIEAMELYDIPSSVPARFGGPGSACGVVAVWTRSGQPGRGPP